DFPFQRPPHGSVHTLLFPGHVHFGQGRACISFSAQYLALPVRRDEQAARAMLRNALPLTVLPYRRDRLLASRARALMVANPCEHRHAPSLATALNVSVRTLHRQLEEEGTSLQALKDTVRRKLACEQLGRTAQSIKQIARSVGFASEKTFTRAFRQWTGVSPGEYRQKASTASP
ncbi:MAG: AraC family transcriptional regulator, partial [Cupriavidus sp.]